MTNSDSALTALALVEACLLENGKQIQAIARATPADEVGMVASALAVLFAAHLESTQGVGGGIEVVDSYRRKYIHAAAAGEAP